MDNAAVRILAELADTCEIRADYVALHDGRS